MHAYWHLLGQRSYSRRWLIRACVTILAVSVGVAWLVRPAQVDPLLAKGLHERFHPETSNPGGGRPTPSESLTRAIETALSADPVDAGAVFGALLQWGLGGLASPPPLDLVSEQPWRPVAEALYQSAAASPEQPGAARRPNAALTALLEQDPPPRWAYFAAGQLAASQSLFRAAAGAFEQEATRYENQQAAEWAVDFYQLLKADDDLARVAANPLFAPFVSKRSQQRAALKQGDVLAAVSLMFPYWLEQLTEVPGSILVITLISGFFWWAFAFNYANPAPGRDRRRCLLLSIVAVLLGAFSTQVTLLIISIQRDVFDILERYDPSRHGPLYGLAFQVFGVGLREELAKLACFLPLVPVLKRHHRSALWLLCAGCVGLGFAIEENLTYVAGNLGAAITPRFMTANFLHMTLTAMVGFQAVRVARNPREALDDFLQILALAVVAHGLYNALLSVPDFGDGSYFSFAIFILIGYQYFHLLRSHSPGTRRRFSLTSIFAIGLATTVGASLATQASWAGLYFAGLSTGAELLGIAVISVMYFQQINETLQA